MMAHKRIAYAYKLLVAYALVMLVLQLVAAQALSISILDPYILARSAANILLPLCLAFFLYRGTRFAYWATILWSLFIIIGDIAMLSQYGAGDFYMFSAHGANFAAWPQLLPFMIGVFSLIIYTIILVLLVPRDVRAAFDASSYGH